MKKATAAQATEQKYNIYINQFIDRPYRLIEKLITKIKIGVRVEVSKHLEDSSTSLNELLQFDLNTPQAVINAAVQDKVRDLKEKANRLSA